MKVQQQKQQQHHDASVAIHMRGDDDRNDGYDSPVREIYSDNPMQLLSPCPTDSHPIILSHSLMDSGDITLFPNMHDEMSFMGAH